MTKGIQSLLTPIEPNLYYLPDRTLAQVQITKDEEYNHEWLKADYMKIGAITVFSLLSLNVLAIIFSTVYRPFNRRIGR